MISLTAQEAFRIYEAARHRLPPVRNPEKTSRRVETLEEIADQFDVFLLDAFGVLNVGSSAIPGVRERINDLTRRGKQVLVVSNAASIPHVRLEEKYRSLGYDFDPDDIITSRRAMAAFMETGNDFHWGVMDGSGSGLDDVGPLRTTTLEDDPESYRRVDGFLLVGSATWTEARQGNLEAALADNPRRVLVANPDVVAPRETGFSAEPGHFAHRLANQAGIEPEFFGKPFPAIFDLAFARTGPVDKARVVMVGDSLHTDILGAQSAGVASALVTDFGFFAGQDVQPAIDSTGIVPDFVVRRP